MGRGAQDQVLSTPAQPSRRGQRARPRPYQDLSVKELDRRIAEAEAIGNRRDARELDLELWRRPGGCGVLAGVERGRGTAVMIDADRRKIVMRAGNGELMGVTLSWYVNYMSDGRVRLPEEPGRWKHSGKVVEYGQNGPEDERGPLMPPGHKILEAHPESVEFAEAVKAYEAEMNRMSEIRPHTDIVEFERLWWQQRERLADLSERVQTAGGYERSPDPAEDMWGARYASPPEVERGLADDTRARYEHIAAMRERGEPDSAIIAYLEDVYGSPFGGPRPGT